MARRPAHALPPIRSLSLSRFFTAVEPDPWARSGATWTSGPAIARANKRTPPATRSRLGVPRAEPVARSATGRRSRPVCRPPKSGQTIAFSPRRSPFSSTSCLVRISPSAAELRSEVGRRWSARSSSPGRSTTPHCRSNSCLSPRHGSAIIPSLAKADDVAPRPPREGERGSPPPRLAISR